MPYTMQAIKMPSASVTTLLAGSFLLQMASSGLYAAIPLYLAVHRQSALIIGVIVSVYALGFFIGCFSANRLIRLVGHIRAFAILAAIAASFAGMIALTESPIVWGVVRLLAGVCAAGLTVVTES